jgi:Protein of unknown function (DUF3347)
MTNLISGFAIAAISLTSCNNSNSKTAENQNVKKDTAVVALKTDTIAATTSTVLIKNTNSIKEIVTVYLQLKNAFTKDKSNDAATSATSLQAAFKNFDKTALVAGQNKIFADIADDATEHAEHISTNAGNIAHQREHFEMLSKDITDLIKTFGSGGQTLYRDFCPMYNNNKGAFWISETKEIKNPYLGKAMPTCGTMKEEIK